MPLGVVIPLVLLVLLVVTGLLVVRRMGRLVAADRALSAYLVTVRDLRVAALPALERGATAADAVLHGQRTAGAGLAECVQAATELEQARGLHRPREVPATLGPLPDELEGVLDGGARAIESLVAALERLHPGAAADDPDRLAAERAAKRARLAALSARDEITGLEERIEVAVEGARAGTGWRRGAAA